MPSSNEIPLPGAGGRVVELDVRDDLRNGREPFSRIMAAVASLGAADVLHLRATFEPVPLFRVMASRGLSHVARREGPEDWSVWFHRRTEGPAAAPGAPSAAARATDDAMPHAAPGGARGEARGAEDLAVDSAREIVLDVRGLEPPEPMIRTLAALETLPPDAVLVQHNERVPRFLLPILDERGFRYDVDESAPGAVTVRIRGVS